MTTSVPIEIIIITQEITNHAADLKVQYRIGQVVAILAALAKLHNVKCNTADSDFIVLKKEIKLTLIPKKT